MLTSSELAQAEELLLRLREITRPDESPYVRDGAKLAALLDCSRTTAWEITKLPDFPAAIELGPKLRLRPRAAILEWLEQRRRPQPLQAEKSPGQAAPAEARITAQGKPRSPRGSITDRPIEYAPKRRRASRQP